MSDNKSILLLGNCLDSLKELPDDSVDSIVTDPPYGLSFMGKKWDYDVPSIAIWRECLRVLKPGGHLLSFGGTRTYHRLVVNIEDAGFEIRDCIQWLYGSGFPKSHNIKEGDFQGWGTALKPANEPICVARKPLEKGLTVAQNVLKWGTGALNIDASRVGPNPGYSYKNGPGDNSFSVAKGVDGTRTEPVESTQGRWPANIILDEEAAAALDEQSGVLKNGGPIIPNKNIRGEAAGNLYGNYKPNPNPAPRHDKEGGASRFFYVAKASKYDRGTDNNHPTVKPIKLMQYLIKLVTPPQGIVLDPFMGSGSTGVAAVKDDYTFIGCEMSEEYMTICEKRINGGK